MRSKAATGCLLAAAVSTPYFPVMGTTPTDIDPTTELIEEDEEQSLPELDAAIDLAQAVARAGDSAVRQSRAFLTRRLPHDRCQGDVLYVGKARSRKARHQLRARPAMTRASDA